MKLFRLILVSLAAVGTFSQTQSSPNKETSLKNDSPIKLTVCELLSDPGKYNHKLVEVSAFVSRGFEDSGLFEQNCNGSDDISSIWLEIGGRGGTGTMYCCNVAPQSTRPTDLVVENISIPLVEDELYRKFDKTMTAPVDPKVKVTSSVAHATLLGRFFAGKKTEFPRGTRWTGYGHMGFYSLFVVQQVLSVDDRVVADLDYSESGQQHPDFEKEGCNDFTDLETDSKSKQIEDQKKADSGSEVWRVDDPERVAKEKIRAALRLKDTATINLVEDSKSNGRRSFCWRPKGKKGPRYFIALSRPYLLSFRAKAPQFTIWVVQTAFSMCDGSEQRIFH